jgi:hypothetical protein
MADEKQRVGRRIPSANDLKNGYGGMFYAPGENREESVLLGHPEVAAQYSMGFDNNDPFLESNPTRCDLDYVSEEDIRKKSKGGW